MQPVLILLFALMLVFAPFENLANAHTFETYYEYEKETIKTFKKGHNGEPLFLERAWVEDDDISLKKSMERIQVSDAQGKVLAFTPTRVNTVVFCHFKWFCWVFMWKTIYPFPAIYSFDPRPEKWNQYDTAPMRYSQRGAMHTGFKVHYNLLIGAFGVMLFYLQHAWYFLISTFFTLIMCWQMTAYHNMDKDRKNIIRFTLTILTSKIPLGFIVIDPYFITAFILLFWMVGGIGYFGVPLVLSAAAIMGVFFVSVIRTARAKTLHK